MDGDSPTAACQHPSQISARHIVRRVSDQDVKLLANLLPFIAPGVLLAAMRGEAAWPHNVYRLYWPLATAHSWQLAAA